MKKFYLARGTSLGGVCQGISNYFEIDVTLIRIIALCMLLIPGSPVIWVYIIVWIAAPKEPKEMEDERTS